MLLYGKQVLKTDHFNFLRDKRLKMPYKIDHFAITCKCYKNISFCCKCVMEILTYFYSLYILGDDSFHENDQFFGHFSRKLHFFLRLKDHFYDQF